MIVFIKHTSTYFLNTFKTYDLCTRIICSNKFTNYIVNTNENGNNRIRWKYLNKAKVDSRAVDFVND